MATSDGAGAAGAAAGAPPAKKARFSAQALEQYRVPAAEAFTWCAVDRGLAWSRSRTRRRLHDAASRACGITAPSMHATRSKQRTPQHRHQNNNNKRHLVDGGAPDLDRELASGGAMFKCEYYNQVFGESEEVAGYKGLKVDVWLDARAFHAWCAADCFFGLLFLRVCCRTVDAAGA